METERTVLTEITQADVGRFVEVPFAVPEGIAQVRVRIVVAPHESGPCTIDVGICDPVRVRGWSGSARYDITVGQDEATPGYAKGDILPGRWAVLLGVYMVGSKGADVTAEITLVSAEKRWLKGDLHVHTVHSDGAYTLAELDRIARDLALDFIGLTDHNTISQNYSYPRETPVVYIPAMEFTTYRGHANLFGIGDPCDDFRAQSATDVASIFAEAKRRGASISINHPFDDAGPSCRWQWGYDHPFDWLEVWNGPWRESNQQSLELWHSMLCAGGRATAVGGSDTHREHPYVRHGYPTTHVYAKSRTVEHILEALHTGRVTMSYCPDGPRLELRAPDAGMGGDSRQRSFDVVLTAAEPGDEVVLFSEMGEVKRYTVLQSGDFAAMGEHEAKKFLRAELWRHFPQVNRQLMAALTNPIFMHEATVS